MSAEIKDQEPALDMREGAPMNFLSHLGELRRRLVYAVWAIFLGCGVAFYYSERIYNFMLKPLLALLPPDQQEVYFIGLVEPFMVYLKLSIIVGLGLATPVIFYQLWAFVAPGLYKHERKNVIPLALGSVVLFLSGVSFCYWLVLPRVFNFFLHYSQGPVKSLLTMTPYLSLFLALMLGFGVIFQMPLVMVVLGYFGLINAKFLVHNTRWAILIIFVVAAVLTPGPDVISQFSMALPMLFLYLLSIILVWFIDRGRRKKKDQAEASI